MSTHDDTVNESQNQQSAVKKRPARERPDAALRRRRSMSPIDSLVADAEAGDLRRALMLIFWKMRFEDPTFTVEIDPKDIKGFDDCTNFLVEEGTMKKGPEIRVYRPGGIPAVEPIPAKGNRRAVPGRPARPPKELVIVQMVDADGNGFVPIENNERDYDRQQDTNAKRRSIERARLIADQLAGDLSRNEFSENTVKDAIATLRLLGNRA